MIDAGMLAAMRAAQEDLLPDTCTIQTATEAPDAIGQVTRTWSNTATGVACRLVPNRIQERDAGARVTVVGDWVLTVAHDRAVAQGQRVVVGTRTFDVVSVNTAESWETATRAGLVEVV